jgi:hypothetical protein
MEGRAQVVAGGLAQVLAARPVVVFGPRGGAPAGWAEAGGWWVEVPGAGRGLRLDNGGGGPEPGAAVWATHADGRALMSVTPRGAGAVARLHGPLVPDAVADPYFPDLALRLLEAAAPPEPHAWPAPTAPPPEPMELGPWLLLAALAFLALDGLTAPRRAAALLAILCLALPGPAWAQGDPPLAYIASGDPAVDHVAQAGLTRLATVLRARTSVRPPGAAPIAPDDPDLPLHAFVYWPLGPAAQPLAGAQARALQRYLDHGGVLVLDVFAAGPGARGAATGDLVLPDLAPVGPEHPLGRVFYRLPELRARGLWAEAGAPARVIVLTDTLADGWAAEDEGALRAGVNIALYAATGTYRN